MFRWKGRIIGNLMNMVVSRGLDPKLLVCRNYFRKLKRFNDATHYLLTFGVDLEKLLMQKAAITRTSVEEIKKRVKFLQSIGIEEQNLGMVLTKGHRIILADVEELEERVDYLRNLGLTNTEIVNSIVVFPKLIVMHSQINIQPRIDYLRSLLLSEENITSIIRSNPTCLNYTPAKLQERTTSLQHMYLQLSDNDVRQVILQCPRLLSMKSSYVIRSLLWLKNNQFDQEEMHKLILKYPVFLTLDLEKVDSVWRWMNESGLISTQHVQLQQKALTLEQELLRQHRVPYYKEDIINYPYIFEESLDKLKNRFLYLDHLSLLKHDKVSFEAILASDDQVFAASVARSDYSSYQKFIQGSIMPW